MFYKKQNMENYRQNREKAENTVSEKQKKVLMTMYRNKHGLPKEKSIDDGISK